MSSNSNAAQHLRKDAFAVEQTVENCYEILDRIFPNFGLNDFTDGKYDGDETLPYEEAQTRQHDWLLDQVECGPASRLLDIGCGNGTLLKRAQSRGAEAVGITISPAQVARCRAQGLDVRLLNYRDMDRRLHERFDAVIANGSMEHFVQPDDAIHGRQEDIYREFFALCRAMLDGNSAPKRVATTVIHFDRFRPSGEDAARSPLRSPPGSDRFHLSMLERCYGGFYPLARQLERCAAGRFRMVHEIDGTNDYRITSEEWLRRTRRGLLNPLKLPRITWSLLPLLLRRPRHTTYSMLSIMTESWQWQFRGESPPMKLFRHVWEAVDH